MSTKQTHARSLPIVLGFALLVSLVLAGCPEAGNNSITSELLKPVTVTITGTVTDSQTALAVAGARVKVQRYDPVADLYTYVKKANGTDDIEVLTAADGAFDLLDDLTLDVDSYQYFLYISDPGLKYYDNGSMSIYSMRDTALGYPALKLVSKAVTSYTATISGTVSSVQTGAAVAGATVKIRRLKDNAYTYARNAADTADLSATTAVGGTFAFTDPITLDVGSYQYFLSIVDPSGEYYDNESTSIYVVGETALAFPELKMVSKATTTYTVVSGTVKDLLDGVAVSGLTVKLYRKGQATADFTATTAATTGIFSIPKVPAATYSLELDGSGLGTPYIKEASDIVLENELTNPLGDLLVSKAIAGDDLRIVLSWTDTALKLESAFSLPVPSFDFNHLGTKQVKLGNYSDISINPASKFAAGTAYWPENMGGAADAANRVVVNPSNKVHSVSTPTAHTVVELVADAVTGLPPQITTIYKRNPLSAYPTNLAYYYEFTKSGIKTYYPVGMGVFNVSCAAGSIYDSGATVKVYQGATYLGKFSAAALATDAGESNRQNWQVLQVEIGYTTPNPTAVSDIYFRVVPYGSAGALPASRFADYFYQETALPGTESFTIYLDQSKYVKDYLFGISSPPVVPKIVGSATGKLYGYDSYNYTTPGWTSPAVYSWKEHTAVSGDTRAITMGIYTPLKAQVLYLAKQPWGPGDSDPSLYSGYGYDPLNVALASVGGAGQNISDAALVGFVDGHYFTLMATSAGPRGTSTKTGYDTLDLGSFFIYFWEDMTTDAVLSTGTPRELTHVLAMRDRYGAIGKYALIGGQGLFVFNASYTTYDAVTRARFWDVNANGNNLSSANFIVRAIAQEPVVGASVHFIVSVVESPSLTEALYDVNMNLSGAVDGVFAQSYPPPSAVNDILYITSNFKSIAIAGTDTGLYVYNPNDYHWYPYLASMLGGFKITKLFDYNGKLGVFAEGNGLMYGPYPE